MTQRFSFLVSLMVYLESGQLATRAQVADVLGGEIWLVRLTSTIHTLLIRRIVNIVNGMTVSMVDIIALCVCVCLCVMVVIELC